MKPHMALPAFSDRSPRIAFVAVVLAAIVAFDMAQSTAMVGLLEQSAAAVSAAVHAAMPGAARGAATEVDALHEARASGRRVELLSDRTETSQTFVNPSGTLTLEESVVPVRVHLADGSWTPVNPSLHKLPNGTVAPMAVEAPVAFSGGGTRPMATMTSGSSTLTYWWPGSLPAPRLSGDTATYAEVLPGVDLQLRASTTGFSQLLVVKDAAAAGNPALGELRFPIRMDGASLSADSTGAISAVDRSGRQLFQAPASSMWDSGSQRAAVQVAISGGVLDLRPDAAILANPATVFPVTIDPDWVGWTGTQQAWAKVSANFPTQTYWNGANDPDTDKHGAVKVGRAPADSGDNTLWRTYFRLDTSRIEGKLINSASFTVSETWSVSCAPKPIELDQTKAINSGTTWNTKPDTIQTLYNDVKASYAWDVAGSSCAGAHPVIFGVKSLIKQAADGSWSNVTLSLRAPDEGTCYANPTTDTCEFHRMDSGHLVNSAGDLVCDVNCQNAPFLSIEYDTPPDPPSNMYVEGSQYLYPGGKVPCDGQNHFIATTTPVLHAYVSDPDEGPPAKVAQPLSLQFPVFLQDLPTPAVIIVSAPSVNADGPQQLTFPSGVVGNGGYIQLSPDTYDGITDTGASSGCNLTVDTTPQTTLPLVSGPTVTPAGTPVQFGFSTPLNSDSDVAGYLWGMNTPPSRLATGSTATVTVAPNIFGTNELEVQVIGQGGMLGPVQDYLITATKPTGPTVMANWGLDETTGNIAHDSVGGDDMTVNAGAGSWSWTTAGHTGGALQLNGGAYASGSVPAINTEFGFTVSAWVNLADTNNGYTLVSENGQNNPAFYLKEASGVWTFAMGTADTSTAPLASVSSNVAAAAGVWTQVIGVYCNSTSCGASGGGMMYLYVGTGNGATLQTTQTPFSSPWQAVGGDVEIGRNLYHGQGNYYNYMNGTVDDVTMYWGDPCPAPSASTVCTIP
jgi:hypothetical protein